MDKLKVAVVGPGEFARVCHIPGIRCHGNAELVAVCGRDAVRTAAFAEQEGIAASYVDLDQMMKELDFDALAIATPDQTHYEIATKAIACGKHVFCEKPLAMNVAEAREMTELAENAGLINMVAFTFRYMHALREMKRLIYSGLIGRPFHVETQVYWGDFLCPETLSWRDQSKYSAAGIWADAGAHLFDAIAYLFAPVDEVFAQIRVIERELGFAQPETADFARCLAHTNAKVCGKPSDISVLLQASRLARPRGPVHELQVFGTRGTLGMPLTRGNDEYLSLLKAGASDWEPLPLPSDAASSEPLALGRMMRAFVDAIIGGSTNKEYDASFRDGLNAQFAIEAGLKSNQSKRSEPVNYRLANLSSQPA